MSRLNFKIGDSVRFIDAGDIGELNRRERPSMMGKEHTVCGFSQNGGTLIELESKEGNKEGAFLPLRLCHSKP